MLGPREHYLDTRVKVFAAIGGVIGLAAIAYAVIKLNGSLFS